MRLSTAAMIAFAAGALGACTNAPVTSETITRVRVLAIKAEPASVVAGEQVTLDALVVSPVENDPGIAITWYLCQYATLDECAKAKDMHVVGHGNSVTLPVPFAASPGDSFVVWLDAIKGGQVERALKAVPIISFSDAPNHNPAFAAVRFTNSLLEPDVTSLAKGARVDVHATAAGNPAEFYFDSNENAAEDLEIHTYTTGGFLTDPSGTSASGEMYYTAPDAKGTYGAWVVINDGRGGVDWRGTWLSVPGGN
ncbi:MAG TPA: hypothetical protein VMV18_06180 [bacterium]|nr:hypothetical protein [bacterium]